jgi:ElaB/YqjD/DUF883 family membrane-anchored ribosome-binding protein
MADPLWNPLEPDRELPAAEKPLTGTPPLAREIENVIDARPVERERERRLSNAAESVGSTVGGAIGAIRNKVQSGIELVKRRSSDSSSSIEDLADTVRERADDVTRETRRVAQEWTSAAQRRLRTLRTQVGEFSEERPAEFIVAIGAVAAVAGLILRVWRSNRE